MIESVGVWYIEDGMRHDSAVANLQNKAGDPAALTSAIMGVLQGSANILMAHVAPPPPPPGPPQTFAPPVEDAQEAPVHAGDDATA